MTTITRVELHEIFPGDKPDYDLLHTAMSEAGFQRYFFAGMKKKWLPTGTYHTYKTDSLSDLLSAVQRAAAKTGHRSCGIIFRGTEERDWGLKEEPLKLAQAQPKISHALVPPPGFRAVTAPPVSPSVPGIKPPSFYGAIASIAPKECVKAAFKISSFPLHHAGTIS